MKPKFLFISLILSTASSAVWSMDDHSADIADIVDVTNKWVRIISKDSGKALDSWGDNDQIGKHSPHYSGYKDYSRQLWKIVNKWSFMDYVEEMPCSHWMPFGKMPNAFVLFSREDYKSTFDGKVLDSWEENVGRVGKFPLHYSDHQEFERQLWRINKVDKDHYMIVSLDTGKALDSWGDNDQIGKHSPHVPDYQDYSRQLWKIIPDGS